MNKSCLSNSRSAAALALRGSIPFGAPVTGLLLSLSLSVSFWLQPLDAPGGDSIYTDTTQARGMFADRKAVHVGDLLSVIVQENSTATKDVSTKTGKSSSIDAGIDSFFFSPTHSKFLTKGGALPALKLASKNDFDGSGQINNSEKLVARVQVTVKDVLPNGNLVVEGKRQTAYSGETQDMVLRGVVRPADVTPNNTVFSYQVADATINIVSKGVASNSTKKGWFTRIWDKVAPF